MTSVHLDSCNKTVTEEDNRALFKAKRIELERKNRGWRYYKINDRLQVLVPFGDDGNPTSEGERIIAHQKALLGIK